MSNMDFFNISTCNNYLKIEMDNSDAIGYFDPIEEIKKQITSFTLLDNNWDGYNGRPLSVNICEKAIKLILILNSTYIDSISDISPNPNGTLTIDWENFDGEKISLEIGGNTYSFFVKYAHKEPIFIDGEDIIQNIKILTEKLGELFGQSILFFIFKTKEL